MKRLPFLLAILLVFAPAIKAQTVQATSPDSTATTGVVTAKTIAPSTPFQLEDDKGPVLTCTSPEKGTTTFKDCALLPDRTISDAVNLFADLLDLKDEEQMKERLQWYKDVKGLIETFDETIDYYKHPMTEPTGPQGPTGATGDGPTEPKSTPPVVKPDSLPKSDPNNTNSAVPAPVALIANK
jgi:hypothetical protein